MLNYKRKHYSAGLCNIGPKEIKKRYAFGIIGFVITAVILFFFIFYNFYYLFFTLLFFPLFLGFTGFYQGYFKFCVANAYKGVYDLSDVGGGKGTIKNASLHREDLKHARKLLGYPLSSSIIVTLLIILVIVFI